MRLIQKAGFESDPNANCMIVTLSCNALGSETFHVRGFRPCGVALKRRDTLCGATVRMEKSHEKPSFSSSPDDGKCSSSANSNPAPGRCGRDDRTGQPGRTTISRSSFAATTTGRPGSNDGATASSTSAGCAAVCTGPADGTDGGTSRSGTTGKLSTLFADRDRWLRAGFGT